MAYRVVKRADVEYREVEGAEGFTSATLVGSGTGSVHMELSLCRLEPGASSPALLHAFEESWYILDGAGTASVADLTFDVTVGSFGLTPVAHPERMTAGEAGLTWLRMRAPQPRSADPKHGDLPASDWQPSTHRRLPSETDPYSRWTGQFRESDMGAKGPLAMPGYHGPNIKSIFVRMLVDELLGAEQHTLFVVEFGPRDPSAQFAKEHYHPFEEAYYLLTGSARGTLDGEIVDVEAGDLVWTSVNATHGFLTTSDEPLRWLEVQAPKPPASHGFYFPSDWDCLS
ncbi:hypothetical protein GCM10022239_08040 [Leifsonia bigeumensis]|uniref:Cupin type-2 domain-containing protein n=1 Tax=Leifsonella bigeumensis TaxID=433643 RepID=A0ABP7FA25_9MICO